MPEESLRWTITKAWIMSLKICRHNPCFNCTRFPYFLTDSVAKMELKSLKRLPYTNFINVWKNVNRIHIKIVITSNIVGSPFSLILDWNGILDSTCPESIMIFQNVKMINSKNSKFNDVSLRYYKIKHMLCCPRGTFFTIRNASKRKYWPES